MDVRKKGGSKDERMAFVTDLCNKAGVVIMSATLSLTLTVASIFKVPTTSLQTVTLNGIALLKLSNPNAYG